MLKLKCNELFYQSDGYDFKISQLDKRHCHIEMNTMNKYKFKKSIFDDIIYWMNIENADEECLLGQLHEQVIDWSFILIVNNLLE